jgi:hypothetical protein
LDQIIQEEFISHLFISCIYAKKVMKIVQSELKPTSQWNRRNLKDCLKDWLAKKVVKKYQGMTIFLVCSIWRARNSSIFRNVPILHEVTTSIVLRLSNEFMMDLKVKDPRLPSMTEMDFEFHGASSTGHAKATPLCVSSFTCNSM